MKKRLFALLLAALLLAASAPPAGASGQNVIFVAVNDNLPFDLSDATMPFWSTSGRLYVPYTVFENEALGIYVSYSRTNQTLTLFNSMNSLFFYLNYLRVEDEAGNEYLEPAKTRDGVIFVSVELVCGLFGLSCGYDVLRGHELVRITTGSQAYTMQMFVENAGLIADLKLEKYLSSSGGQEEPGDSPHSPIETDPITDFPPPVEFEIPENEPGGLPAVSCGVALWLEVGAEDWDEIEAVLEILDARQTPAILFFADGAEPTGEFLRRAYASGYKLGLYGNSAAELDAKNERIFSAARTVTRFAAGEEPGVSESGYISCAWDRDASEFYGAGAKSLLSSLPEEGTVVVRFDMSRDGITLLEELLYFDENISYVSVRETMFTEA